MQLTERNLTFWVIKLLFSYHLNKYNLTLYHRSFDSGAHSLCSVTARHSRRGVHCSTNNKCCGVRQQRLRLRTRVGRREALRKLNATLHLLALCSVAWGFFIGAKMLGKRHNVNIYIDVFLDDDYTARLFFIFIEWLDIIRRNALNIETKF